MRTYRSLFSKLLYTINTRPTGGYVYVLCRSPISHWCSDHLCIPECVTFYGLTCYLCWLTLLRWSKRDLLSLGNCTINTIKTQAPVYTLFRSSKGHRRQQGIVSSVIFGGRSVPSSDFRSSSPNVLLSCLEFMMPMTPGPQKC